MFEEKFPVQTYTNPVYPFSFPDPFVLKFRGEYFAYSTGFDADGKVFSVLYSQNLVKWRATGGAMDPLPGNPPFYWAPEVTYLNGKFYLYYSVGNETLMEIRVAVSDNPAEGFIDSGSRLTFHDFAIDAHVFTDDDGGRYMFYATDFLDHTHIGTGTVLDRMIDPFTLEGRPRPVTRARYDWQVYDPARKEKGGVRWHTVEGPFVLKRKGIYYQMFSGGNWQDISYGVSFAATDDITRDEEWGQFSDGQKILPILRTVPGSVIGPGHNSVVRGPNNRELFCIYHRWMGNERVLAIDRMDFAGRRIFIQGATFTPQPAPFKPAVTGFGHQVLEKSVGFEISEEGAVSTGDRLSELIFHEPEPYYLLEVSAQNIKEADWMLGFHLADDTGRILEFSASAEGAELTTDEGERQKLTLRERFAPTAVRHLRVEINGQYLYLALNNTEVRTTKFLRRRPEHFALTAASAGTVFSGLSVTRGFEDLFSRPDTGSYDWRKIHGAGTFEITDGELILTSVDETALTKGPSYSDFEFAVNIRLIKARDREFEYGFMILDPEMGVHRIRICDQQIIVDGESLLLPTTFAPENYHQFRFIKIGESLQIQMEEYELGSILTTFKECRTAIFSRNADIAVEMVRLTDITNSVTS